MPPVIQRFTSATKLDAKWLTNFDETKIKVTRALQSNEAANNQNQVEQEMPDFSRLDRNDIANAIVEERKE